MIYPPKWLLSDDSCFLQAAILKFGCTMLLSVVYTVVYLYFLYAVLPKQQTLTPELRKRLVTMKTPETPKNTTVNTQCDHSQYRLLCS